MKSEKKRRGVSIFRRMMIMLLLVIVAQGCMGALTFAGGGVMDRTRENAFNLLSSRVVNRASYLENDMVSRWSATGESKRAVVKLAEALLEDGGTLDGETCAELVSQAAPQVVAMLRRNEVTGAFLVLDCPDGSGSYPGFYIRDYDPGGAAADDDSDLLLERGTPAVAKELGVALDRYWTPFFNMPDREEERTEFYFKPLLAARAAPAARRSSSYFARWSGPIRLSGKNAAPAVMYSVPLVLSSGAVIGVLGVDVSVSLLTEKLPYGDLDEEDATGAYFLGVSGDGGKTYRSVAGNGPNLQTWFGADPAELTPAATDREDMVRLQSRDGETLYGGVRKLRLYSANTPFEGEEWALIGVQSEKTLFAFTGYVRLMLILALLASLLVGLALVYLVARGISRPITGLVAKLRDSPPSERIKLGSIGVTEIDTLTRTVEQLSHQAVEAAAHTSRIISMTDIPIGVFEVRRGEAKVFCSAGLFDQLCWPDRPEKNAWLDGAEFQRRIEEVTANVYDAQQQIYSFQTPDGHKRWVRMFLSEDGDSTLGAVQDVTRDVEERRKVEYERDYDPLTRIYNRLAFDARLERLFSRSRRMTLRTAALLMFDLDNLKYVNDTYGHDCGDRYLQTFAASLTAYFGTGDSYSVLCRRSGDEFNVFLFGYPNKDAVRSVVDRFAKGARPCVDMPDGRRVQVRSSGGLAWYPDSATDYQQLLRMADFAMYTSKHTVKGEIREVDHTQYAEQQLLIGGQDDLNRLIDEQLVRFAFQPVIWADGRLMGYELLMRPTLESLADLSKLFRLARTQSKLYQLERLTWFKAMETFERARREGWVPEESRAFINSFGSQVLTVTDLTRLETLHQDMLDRVVVEVTEEDQGIGERTDFKREYARKWGAMLALDDYGSGFNGESVLISGAVDVVKVDISIIHQVDQDPDKQSILKNIISYCRERGILVLAEGVETAEELSAVILAGAACVQGFYVGRPELQPRPIPEALAAECRGLYQRRKKG